MEAYEEESNEFNSQLEDQRIIDNQNYYQMLVSTQRHDSQLLSEFKNAARKTNENNEEEEEEEDGYSYREEEEEEPQVRDWQEEIIEEVRRHQCIWNTKSTSFKDRNKKAEAWRRIAETLQKEGMLLLCYYHAQNTS